MKKLDILIFKIISLGTTWYFGTCSLFSINFGCWQCFGVYYTYMIELMELNSIGVVAIGTLGTWALPDKERNLSIRNQKVLKYWAKYKEIRSWCLEGYHFQINACPCLLSSWNIPNSQLVSHFILSQWLSVQNAVLISTKNEKKCPPKKMPQLCLCRYFKLASKNSPINTNPDTRKSLIQYPPEHKQQILQRMVVARMLLQLQETLLPLERWKLLSSVVTIDTCLRSNYVLWAVE